MNPDGRSEVSAVVPVPREEAFHLLEDPASFRDLVAGARKIRRFDSRWPEPGTRLNHTVGFPPLLLRDHTEVIEQRPPEILVLDAMVRPLGRLQVEFRLDPHPAGSLLTVTERPVDGPVSWPVVRMATGLGLQLRNREICRRFRKLTQLRRCSAGTGPCRTA